MKTKLIEILEKNGTGILKGNFRANILSKSCVPGDFDDIYWKNGKLIVSFSKSELALGVHFLLVEKIDKEKGAIFCTLLHNDGDHSVHKPLHGFDDDISIVLFPFSHRWEDDTIGEFIAEFPMGTLIPS